MNSIPTPTNRTARTKAIQLARQVLAQKPVYLDTETTGLDRSAEIIEISIVDDDDHVLLESMVRPNRPISSGAQMVHHITSESLQGALTWPALWPTVRSFLVGRLIVIYNADFDLRLMQQSHASYRLPWKDSFKSMCLMKLYAEFRGEWDPRRMGYRYHSLDTARKHCNLTGFNSHRATDDTRLTRELLHYIANQADA